MAGLFRFVIITVKSQPRCSYFPFGLPLFEGCHSESPFFVSLLSASSLIPAVYPSSLTTYIIFYFFWISWWFHFFFGPSQISKEHFLGEISSYIVCCVFCFSWSEYWVAGLLWFDCCTPFLYNSKHLNNSEKYKWKLPYVHLWFEQLARWHSCWVMYDSKSGCHFFSLPTLYVAKNVFVTRLHVCWVTPFIKSIIISH